MAAQPSSGVKAGHSCGNTEAEERTEQLNQFLGRWPIAGARQCVLEACKRAGLLPEAAATLADATSDHIEEDRLAILRERPGSPVQLLLNTQRHSARKAHKLAKESLHQLERKRPSLSQCHAAVAKLVVSLKNLSVQKHASASPYVSPLMRYGVCDQTIRMATHRPPAPCREPRCSSKPNRNWCRCRIWPEGSPDRIDPFAEFDVPAPPKIRDLDPRKYRLTDAVGLLRLYVARFDLEHPPWPRKKGRPEPLHDQDLIDDLCIAYERFGQGRARHDITKWSTWLSTILDAYGLSFLDTENRMKRFETYKANQVKRFGAICFPRGVEVPALPSRRTRKLILSKTQLEREKILRSQFARHRLDSSIFMGEV